MTTKLENLSLQFTKQYNEIPMRDHVVTKYFWIIIDRIQITVTVAMQRIKNDVPVAKTAVTDKTFTNIASVTIKPPNDKVKEAVSNHFKNQVKPTSYNAIFFDSVKINEELIDLHSG